MKQNTLSAIKIIFTTMVLVAFFCGVNSCDRGDLCNSDAPEVVLLKDRKVAAPISKMIWLYSTKEETDTINLALIRSDSVIVKYPFSSFNNFCYDRPSSCTVYSDEIESLYGGSEKLGIKTWTKALDCPIEFELYLNDESFKFEISDNYSDLEDENQLEKWIVRKDSGLVYFKDKKRKIEIKRIK